MLQFMDYVQTAFYARSKWNVDNSYSSLTSTTAGLLDFSIPHGIRFHVSSLSTPAFATSYTLGVRGLVDGNLSFLYSNIALHAPSRSGTIDLQRLVRGYRQLHHLGLPPASALRADDDDGKGAQDARRKDTLLYGRLYLPASTLEALYLRRISPTRLLRLASVSDSNLPNGGSLLAVLQNDHGKYSTEYLYSTDSSLLGFRTLYNFGYDPRKPNPSTPDDAPSPRPRHPWDTQHARLSAGAEAYFSPLNKTGGLSTGLRFATLPVHTGSPYTMTLTLNPLMGNLSSAYAAQAGPNLALCSRFDFNVYSYESDVSLGLELWRRRAPSADVAWARELLRPELGWGAPREEDVEGVLKARVTDKGKVGVLWECRAKELLVTLGAGFDLRRSERMLSIVGLEVAFSS